LTKYLFSFASQIKNLLFNLKKITPFCPTNFILFPKTLYKQIS